MAEDSPYLIPFSFMSLSEFDFLCCYDPHTNEENMVIAGMDWFIMVNLKCGYLVVVSVLFSVCGGGQWVLLWWLRRWIGTMVGHNDHKSLHSFLFNARTQRSLFPEQNKYACYTTAFRAESKLTDQMKIFNAWRLLSRYYIQ